MYESASCRRWIRTMKRRCASSIGSWVELHGSAVGAPRARRVGLLLAALLCAPSGPVFAQTNESPGAVVVTGAPSGIGRKITERLAAKGYFVYAGARTPQEMAELNAI